MHDVDCGNKIIPLIIKRSKRKTLVIQIHPDNVIIVRSPLRYPLKKIENFVREKQSWIAKKQREFKNLPPKSKPIKYIEGDILQFLGKEYELKITPAIMNKITLEDGLFILQSTHPKNNAKNKRFIQDWYKRKAEEIFNERLVDCVEITRKQIDVDFLGEVTLRRMKSRWGSCSTLGDITLNINLICAPLDCVNYVILHELCHLREHNHSRKFYALMDVVMKGWKPIREKLNKSVNIAGM